MSEKLSIPNQTVKVINTDGTMNIVWYRLISAILARLN